MSGVIDKTGQQWERCNECGKFVRFPQNLGYQPHSLKWNGPCSICIDCANKAPNIEAIVPAPDWTAQYEEEVA